MNKKISKKRVLADHKKVGKRLIPPLMQLHNVKLISFQTTTLPCLIWVSAILLRNPDREAVHYIVEFLIMCKEILADDQLPPLVLLSTFDQLNQQQQSKLVSNIKDKEMLDFFQNSLVHQFSLLKNHPLSFLFDSSHHNVDRERALIELKEDVAGLLDRRSPHSTKVQTTAFASMAATGKVVFSSKIELPDFNAVFTDYDSDESKRAAAFVRASINASPHFEGHEDTGSEWSRSFWKQTFEMEQCV